MNPVLCVDVDSTVWDMAVGIRAAVLEVTGEALTGPSDTWIQLLEHYGEETTTRIFDHVHAPDSIAQRDPYPHAPETLRRLQNERGLRIHFVTRNWDADALYPRLVPWLRKHFGPSVDVTIVTGEKLPVLRALEAFGIIDDRPDTLQSAADAGLWVAAKLQPWNRDLVEKREDINGFEAWRDLPELPPFPSRSGV